MSKSEALQKQIDQIADKVRNLRYIFLTIMSAIVALLFGISQNKIIENIVTNSLFIAGGIFIIAVSIFIKTEEEKRTNLIKKLEHTKD